MASAVRVLLAVCLLNVLKRDCAGSDFSSVYYQATVSITYKDPVTNQNKTLRSENGRFGHKSRLEKEEGVVVHVRTANDEHHACSSLLNAIPSERWIALVERGSCKFSEKIRNAAVVKNASAVVIYNHEDKNLVTMEHDGEFHIARYRKKGVANSMAPKCCQCKYYDEDVVSIFIDKKEGQRIAGLVDNNTRVYMQITVGKKMHVGHEGISGSLNKTSVLFVSISFIVLMIISLAWLVFYYIQRFRYAHAKERLSRRLMHAAKKAINKMPMKTLKSEDKEVESGFDQCAVCIEDYRANEVIRILPCKHIFHKSCVDPWLVEHRSCPMCKLDILKAYGLQIHNSEVSLANIELERGSTSVGASDLLHALDSGLSPDEPDGHDHHVEMVCYHGLPSHHGGLMGPRYEDSGETDSSSEGHVPPTCIAPDIHIMQNRMNEISEFSRDAESSALLEKCTCNQKRSSPGDGPQCAARDDHFLHDCGCSRLPQGGATDTRHDVRHITESSEDAALLGDGSCTCDKAKRSEISPSTSQVSMLAGSDMAKGLANQEEEEQRDVSRVSSYSKRSEGGPNNESEA